MAGQTVQVMHGSNAPLLGRIIHEHMDKLKSGNPVVDTISLDDAVPGRQEQTKQKRIIRNHSLSRSLKYK